MLSSVDVARRSTFSLIFGVVNVLFVRVCVFVVPTTAPVAPCASVRFACVVISEVSATVPVASGSVIVRSAVGSVTARVVSKAFAVEPSNVILESNTPTAAGLAHSRPYVAPEFAVRTWPFVPTPKRAIASTPDATRISPFASTIASVITFLPPTVAVAPSTIRPYLILKSFVTVAILYLLVGYAFKPMRANRKVIGVIPTTGVTVRLTVSPALETLMVPIFPSLSIVPYSLTFTFVPSTKIVISVA